MTGPPKTGDVRVLRLNGVPHGYATVLDDGNSGESGAPFDSGRAE
jgi:hypothetical protein